MKLSHLLFAAALVVAGAGCRSAEAPTPPKPIPHCPDVCAAVCSGQPEPMVPSDCPMPMCACDPLPPEVK